MGNTVKRRSISFVAVFLALCLVLVALPALACERDYSEEAAYWEKVYQRLEKESKDKTVSDPLLGDILAMPGITFWGPKVQHIAILDNALKEWETRGGKYTDARFPLYCGYIVFDQNRNITFVKKTDLPIKEVMKFIYGLERTPTTHDDDFNKIQFHWMIANKVRPVQPFFGLYGMDFVPRFKHRYAFGQRPEGLSDEDLLELENHWDEKKPAGEQSPTAGSSQ